jgi:hypothetical protein
MSAAFYFGERFSERRTLRDDALLVRIGRFRIVELLGAYARRFGIISPPARE